MVAVRCGGGGARGWPHLPSIIYDHHTWRCRAGGEGGEASSDPLGVDGPKHAAGRSSGGEKWRGEVAVRSGEEKWRGEVETSWRIRIPRTSSKANKGSNAWQDSACVAHW